MDRVVESSRSPRDTLELKNAAERYGPQYLREQEIKTMFTLLEQHPVFMIMGDLGQGKSTFIGEAAQFARQMRKHGRFTHSLYFFDIHTLDGHIRSPLTIGGSRNVSQPKDIIKTARPVLDWLDHQPKGPRLEEIPSYQRSILFLDAGDALFLEFAEQQHFPSYKSIQWNVVTALNGDNQRNYLQDLIRRSLWDAQYKMTAIRKQAGLDPRTEIPWDTLDNWAYLDTLHLPLYRTYNETRELLLDRIGQALQEGRTRVVLTDHGYSRERFRKLGEGSNREAVLHLLNKYDNLFTDAYRYNLPARYNIDKARLLLQRDLGIDDSQLQDEIIAVTGGSHKLMKLALTPKVNQQLKESQTADLRYDILLNAIKPFIAYR